MAYGARWLGVLLFLAAPSVAGAQLAPIGVPPGVLRVEVDGQFDSWDKRFRDGNKEGLGAIFSSQSFGGNLLPALAPYDTIVRRVTGLSNFGLNLGTPAGDAQADVSSAVLGLSLGVTRSIAVFGRLPLTRARMQTTLRISTDGANAGFNPGPGTQSPFFTEFDAALNTLEAQIAAGAYDADPARRALADATLAEGDALFDDLFRLLGDPNVASPFVPLATSDAGTAIDTRIASLQGTLGTTLGVGGFSTRPELPTTPASSADVEALARRPVRPGRDPDGQLGADVPGRRGAGPRGDHRRPLGREAPTAAASARPRKVCFAFRPASAPGSTAPSRSAPATDRPTSRSAASWISGAATSASASKAATPGSSPPTSRPWWRPRPSPSRPRPSAPWSGSIRAT